MTAATLKQHEPATEEDPRTKSVSVSTDEDGRRHKQGFSSPELSRDICPDDIDIICSRACVSAVSGCLLSFSTARVSSLDFSGDSAEPLRLEDALQKLQYAPRQCQAITPNDSCLRLVAHVNESLEQGSDRLVWHLPSLHPSTEAMPVTVISAPCHFNVRQALTSNRALP